MATVPVKVVSIRPRAMVYCPQGGAGRRVRDISAVERRGLEHASMKAAGRVTRLSATAASPRRENLKVSEAPSRRQAPAAIRDPNVPAGKGQTPAIR